MPTYTFPAAAVLIEATGEFAIGATGVLRPTNSTEVQPVYDLNGSAISGVLVGSKGAHQPFKADIAYGVLDFGSVLLPVTSLEAMQAGFDAVTTATAAEATANNALTAAQAAQSAIAPATETSTGTIALAGDLAGTPTAPEVPALADRASIAHQHNVADLPAGGINMVKRAATGWRRPTSRTDISVFFKLDAPDEPTPPIVAPPSLDGMYSSASGVLGDVVLVPTEATVAGAPSAPTGVGVTRTNTVATVSWSPPTSDGGSPVTGYRVTQAGGSTQELAATARSTDFTGLVSTSSYSFTVTAFNAVGSSPGVTVNAAATATVTNTSRFPGDTNPLVTGKVIWGIDEFDQDPKTIDVSEVSAPEAVAGVPVGSMRTFFNSAAASSPIATSGGAAYSAINKMHNNGRLPWISLSYTNWAVQSDGRNNAAWDFFINWCETSAKGPVWFTMIHEPENQTVGHPGTATKHGTEADWYNVQKAFRARMTAYASTRGGSSYKWKNLAFTPCLTAYAYWRGANAYGIDRYVTQQAANQNPGTDRIFDFMGADYYVGGQNGTIGSPAWGANIVAAVAWCKKWGYPLGIAEWGVNRRDTAAAAKMQEIWDRTFDGTNDIVCWNYYNSSVGSTDPVQQRWLLDNVDNGGLLNKYVALLKNTKSVHFYDLKDPQTNTLYPRPTGI